MSAMLTYRCAWCNDQEPVLLLVIRHFKNQHPRLEKRVLDASPTARDGQLTLWTDPQGLLMFLSCPESENETFIRGWINSLKE